MEIRKDQRQLCKPGNDGTEPPLNGRKRKVMIALWHRLTQYWPHWESLYGDVDGQPIYLWQKALSSFTELDLKGALTLCEDWTGKFPPTFPEFKQLCKAAKVERHARVTVQPQNPEVKSLEALGKGKRTDTEEAKRHKARLRRMLAGEEVETKEESMRILGL